MSSLTYDDVKRDIKKYCATNKISGSKFARQAGLECHTLLAFIRKDNGATLKHLFAVAKLLGYTNQTVTDIYLSGKNLSGKTFGHWKVLKPVTLKEPDDGQIIKYLCQCRCGKRKEVNAKSLLRGLSVSCGCGRADNFTEEQVKGKLQGQQIMDKLHEERLSPCYGKPEPNKNSQSGIRGVCPYKDKWRVTITAAGKWYNIGIFDDLQDAIAARKQAEIDLHGPLQDKANKIKSAMRGRRPSGK